MTANVTPSAAAAYEVRRYRPDDRSEVVDLLARFVEDAQARFAWACEDNPYLDHVPMAVAVADGRVVAAQPAIALRLRLAGRELLALLSPDPVVHPDHRGQGLPERLDERLQAVYEDREPALCFAVGGPGDARDGWRAVGRVATAYRLHRPRALLDGDARFHVRAGLRLLGSALRTARRVRDRPVSGLDAVVRTDHVPVRTLTDLARQHPPTGLHALRNPRHLSWRFQRPGWTYRTYLTGSDTAQAAAVVGVREREGRQVVALTDVYPPDSGTRPSALERVVWAVLDDYSGADVLVAAGATLPASVRRRTRFRLDDQRPVSWLTDPATLLARPASGVDPAATDWAVAGRDLTDPGNWHLSLAERGTW